MAGDTSNGGCRFRGVSNGCQAEPSYKINSVFFFKQQTSKLSTHSAVACLPAWFTTIVNRM